jgi:hypothetical protein
LVLFAGAAAYYAIATDGFKQKAATALRKFSTPSEFMYPF